MSKDWMQIGIAVFIGGMMAYLVVQHSGTGEGQIEPKIIWTALLSIFATKIVDFAYTLKKKSDKP